MRYVVSSDCVVLDLADYHNTAGQMVIWSPDCVSIKETRIGLDREN